MTKSTKNAEPKMPRSFYSIYRGTNGCDETYDIVCNLTGKCIALLGFWEADAETLRDARLMVRALNRLHHRGGFFFLGCFAESMKAIERKYDPRYGGDDDNA
jgi:hypothetical protein